MDALLKLLLSDKGRGRSRDSLIVALLIFSSYKLLELEKRVTVIEVRTGAIAKAAVPSGATNQFANLWVK